LIARVAAFLAAAALSSLAFAADAELAKQLGELINQYRARHDLRALSVERTLATLATEHSAAMQKANRLSHDGFAARVRRSGLAMCVENVGWNYPTAQSQFDGWRASPGHDRNLLDRRVDRMGIGVAGTYVTFIACSV
jgi:uncharacterized protein YkwD